MAARPNTPPRPIIVKKVIEGGHGGHHGGAWKVAYADFVTAMMAFFLLMWLLGATTEKQRKALADYFAPTIVQTKQESAGSNGMFGGDSIVSADNYPHRAGQTGTRSITIPRDVVGGPKEASGREQETKKFQQVAKSLAERVQRKGDLRRLARNLRFTQTVDGRNYLQFRGINSNRFSRIEGVADREPYVPSNRFDPRNRRISITLGWGSAAKY